MAPTAGAGAYDAVAYPSVPYPAAHPDRLATVAHLHRLETADPESCRYLDLACGDGANLLAVAAALPDARFAGLDASREAIERGLALRDAAGLERVELLVADLLDPGAADGLAPADFRSRRCATTRSTSPSRSVASCCSFSTAAASGLGSPGSSSWTRRGSRRRSTSSPAARCWLPER